MKKQWLKPQMNELKTTDLNIEEAKEALSKGYKLRHKYFTENEFIYMEDDIIYDEKNYPLKDFWKIRESESFRNGFKEGWSIII